MPKFLSIRQTCKVLDVSERTLRRMIAAGEIARPVRRNARWVRFDAADIGDYLAKLIAESREPAASRQ